MNRSNNDLRDWLDEGGARLPKGEYGVDGWVNDPPLWRVFASAPSRKTIAESF
jgi:hypothetical protein